MKIATWNINGVKARIDNLLVWLEQTRPESSACRKIKSVTSLSARAHRGPRLPCRDPWPAGFNGVAILSLKSPDEIRRGLPGDPEDSQARYIEAVFLPAMAGDPRCLDLPAERQSAGRSGEISLQAVLDGPASASMPQAFLRMRSRWSLPAITRHPRCGGLLQRQGLGKRRALPARNACGLPPADRAGTDRCVPCRLRRRCQPTRSGTIRQAPGPETTASGSTISYCRPEATTLLRAVRIDRDVRSWKSPRTTCR